ncbi:adenosylmethionine decarboxylase [Nonomuraea cavernae]|uniref:adenosylmethionine decarboxylase n=1 Tax=Nonomuraea cavernae TaxID=2045107 RepID=UPI0033E43AD4
MTSYDFSGVHVMADVYEIDRDTVDDEALIISGLTRGITRSGATLCGTQVKRFAPSGLTALFLLSESHVSVHTYPEQNSLFFDAFTCGSTCDPVLIVEELLAALGPCKHRTKVVNRGLEEARHAVNLALALR